MYLSNSKIIFIFLYKKKHVTTYVTKKNRASPEIVSVLQFRAIYRQAMRPHLINIAGKTESYYPFNHE